MRHQKWLAVGVIGVAIGVAVARGLFDSCLQGAYYGAPDDVEFLPGNLSGNILMNSQGATTPVSNATVTFTSLVWMKAGPTNGMSDSDGKFSILGPIAVGKGILRVTLEEAGIDYYGIHDISSNVSPLSIHVEAGVILRVRALFPSTPAYASVTTRFRAKGREEVKVLHRKGDQMGSPVWLSVLPHGASAVRVHLLATGYEPVQRTLSAPAIGLTELEFRPEAVRARKIVVLGDDGRAVASPEMTVVLRFPSEVSLDRAGDQHDEALAWRGIVDGGQGADALVDCVSGGRLNSKGRGEGVEADESQFVVFRWALDANGEIRFPKSWYKACILVQCVSPGYDPSIVMGPRAEEFWHDSNSGMRLSKAKASTAVSVVGGRNLPFAGATVVLVPETVPLWVRGVCPPIVTDENGIAHTQYISVGARYSFAVIRNVPDERLSWRVLAKQGTVLGDRVIVLAAPPSEPPMVWEEVEVR